MCVSVCVGVNICVYNYTRNFLLLALSGWKCFFVISSEHKCFWGVCLHFKTIKGKETESLWLVTAKCTLHCTSHIAVIMFKGDRLSVHLSVLNKHQSPFLHEWLSPFNDAEVSSQVWQTVSGRKSWTVWLRCMTCSLMAKDMQFMNSCQWVSWKLSLSFLKILVIFFTFWGFQVFHWF